VVYALAEAGAHGFDEPVVLICGLGGLATLALFIWVELHTALPMVDVRLLRDKLFGVSNIVQIVGNAGQMGAFFLLPIFLQAQKGLSPLDTGLMLFPMALGVAVMAQPAAKFYPRIGPRKMMIAGFIGTMLLTFHLATVDYDTSAWWVALNMFLRGISFGLLIIPIQAATFATIKPEDTGRASSIFSVGRQVAASLGVAILATVLANRLGYHDAVLADPATQEGALAAFHDAFIFAGAMAILGILASLMLDDEKAANALAPEKVAETSLA
jgi:predicted MFS family arabinose efflux permease